MGAGWLSLLGFYSLLLTPLGALVALGGCALQLLAAFPRAERRVSPGVAAGLGVVAVVCVVTLAFFLSPLGRALTSWTPGLTAGQCPRNASSSHHDGSSATTFASTRSGATRGPSSQSPTGARSSTARTVSASKP